MNRRPEHAILEHKTASIAPQPFEQGVETEYLEYELHDGDILSTGLAIFTGTVDTVYDFNVNVTRVTHFDRPNIIAHITASQL